MSVTLFNKDLEPVDCNEQALELFGAENKDEYFYSFGLFATYNQPSGKNTKKLLLEAVATAFDVGYAHLPEFVCKKSDGTSLILENTYARIPGGESYLVVEYIRDLTLERKAAAQEREWERIQRLQQAQEQEQQHQQRLREKAEEESREKTRFLARMSHEIRTPLNAVLGIAELQMQKEYHPPETDEAFFRIYNSSNLLLAIINDILDMARVEAGKVEILRKTYDIASLIVDTVQLNIAHRGDKSVEFKLKVDESLPAFMVGDALRIKQIINNFLSNALKYTHEGSVTLSFSADCAQEGRPILIIEISDTGQGMTEQQLEVLFSEEFTRFNEKKNSKIEGSGLGSSIAYQLAKMMDGEIIAESEPGKGSTFTVRVPQKADSGIAVLGKDIAENLERLDFKELYKKRVAHFSRSQTLNGRVLIVDDVKSNLYVIKEMLLPYKIKIETVESGEEAVELIKRGKTYDIIFMDHMMPGIDGIEATRQIRETGYSRPIVALTANAVKGMSEMFLTRGFSGFISKPVDLKRLNACLVRFIRNKQPKKADELNENQSLLDEVNAEGGGLRLIESFIRDAQKTIDIIEPILEEQVWDKGTLKSYTIQAHGIKGALANIGRLAFSEEARVLEQAGRAGDINVINDSTQGFLDDLKKLIFALIPAETENEMHEDTLDLDIRLAEFALACDVYDLKKADDILNELRSKPSSKESKSILENLSAFLLSGAFEEAAELANNAVKDLNEAKK